MSTATQRIANVELIEGLPPDPYEDRFGTLYDKDGRMLLALCSEDSPDVQTHHEARALSRAIVQIPNMQDTLRNLRDEKETLKNLLQAVLDCETCLDEKGHAYLKVPARSIFDLGALIKQAVENHQDEEI